MNCTAKYVALDVHEATTVVSVRSARGRELVRRVLETRGPTLVESLRGLRGAVHVTFDGGTHAQWFDFSRCRWCTRASCAIRARWFGRGTNGIRSMWTTCPSCCESGTPGVYHWSPHGADLTELTRAYRNLIEDGTRVMLRLKALYRARAIPAQWLYETYRSTSTANRWRRSGW